MTRYKLKWRIKDWIAKRQGLAPFYSYYGREEDPVEARRKFEAGEPYSGWIAVLTPHDVPDWYPKNALIRRHVENVLPPWLD